MSKLNPLVICLLILFYNYSIQECYSQEIIGNIFDSNNQPLQSTLITIKSVNSDTTVIKYTTSDKDGNYKIKTPSYLDSILIEFSLFSFKTKSISITNLSKKTFPHILNINLEPNYTKLEEVYIKARKKGIIVKKDTIIYSIENFKDGTEKVVEDIIKKLPGIKIDKNGKISFKGNPIKTVLLDDSNLFDSNYIIGTKNIDIDLIESLSAIENYVENPLLHGIKNTNTVVLNLTLKKGKTDFSNNTSLGLGIENRLDINNNTLGISKKIKSFATFSYNNIGLEKSPYDYFSSNNYNLEETYEKSKSPPRILNTGNFTSQFSEERERINNNLFSSLNAIYQITESLKCFDPCKTRVIF